MRSIFRLRRTIADTVCDCYVIFVDWRNVVFRARWVDQTAGGGRVALIGSFLFVRQGASFSVPPNQPRRQSEFNMNLKSVLGLAHRKLFTNAILKSKPQTRNARLHFQTLEDRAVPATLPAPIVDQTSFQSIGTGYSPITIQNPNNPQQMVTAFVTPAPTNNNQELTNIAYAYSTNGGQSWTTQRFGNAIDPKANPPGTIPQVNYTTATQPSIAFDRFNNFYLANTERNTDGTSGRVVLRKFSFTGFPQQVDLDRNNEFDNNGSNQEQMLYKWSDGDRAYNVNVAVDSHLPPTDPKAQDPVVAGAAGLQTDPFAATQTDGSNTTTPVGTYPFFTTTNNVKVFVTWNTQEVYTQVNSTGEIRQTVSDDGGYRFGAPVVVNDFVNGTMPQVIFTPGRVGEANTGGAMMTTYTTTGGAVITDVHDFDGTNTPSVFEVINENPQGINDALPAPQGQSNHVPQRTYFNLDVPTNVGITAIENISVTLALNHNDLSEIQIRLIKRDNAVPFNALNPDNGILADVTLVRTGKDSAGNTIVNAGITGTNLGIVNGFVIGTTFSDNAQHGIRNGSGAYSGVFRPELGNLVNTFDNLAPNQIHSGGQTGKWQIEITDFRNAAANPAPTIRFARLQLNQEFQDRDGTFFGGGNDTFTAGANSSTLSGTAFGTTSTALPAGVGIGPGVALAVDNSRGAFSPFQNRTYMAHNSGGNVVVRYSDDGGDSWSGATTVGAGFNPAIAVDPTTGTVAVTYYSTIYDPAGVRSVTMLATSVNATVFDTLGSMEFSEPTPINPRDETYDQIRSRTLDVEAIPSNGPAVASANNTEGYGVQMGLVAFGGKVRNVFTGNLNTTGSQIRTQDVSIAAGPRVIDGDMGALFSSSEVTTKVWNSNTHDVEDGPVVEYNNVTGPDGRQAFDGFVIEFDRVIDPTTFTPADIRVIKRRPDDDPQAAPTGSQIITVSTITPLDDYRDPMNDTTQYGSKRFLITVPTQTDVATYSYAIGSDIWDRVRGENFNFLTPSGGTFNSANNINIPDSDGVNPGAGISIVNANGLPANSVVNTISVTLNVTHPLVEQLSFVLEAPNGNQIPLIVAGTGPTGANLTGTVFSDTATQQITNGTSPYTGTFQAASPLSGFFGVQAGGFWRLLFADSVQNITGVINNWSLTLTTVVPTLEVVTGNQVDQNGNSFENQGDADSFAIPKPTGAAPFVLPYVTGSFPISIPGPRMIGSQIKDQPATPDNLVTNSYVSSIDVEFDRTINFTTFTAADVIRITGPLGDIPLTGVSVTPISGLGGTATGANSRFFRIAFTEQKLSGTYHLQLSSKIASAVQEPIKEGGPNVNIELDTNSNAAIGTLVGASAGAAIVTKSYGGTIATPVTIGAKTTTIIPLNVNEGYQVQKAIAEISITHTKTRDLDIRLISPSGQVVLLSSNAPANGPDTLGFTNTKFDDAATTPVQLGAGGFANASFNPIQPLAQLITLGSGGQWKLSITNKGTVIGSVSKFGLFLDAPVVGTGLGEIVADQTPVTFRIFNASGSSNLAKGNWTPVGPSLANEDNSVGRASALAVDPTDPSGNIVYAAGASGGLWKTTNFLTRDAKGPIWIPLTDFGPTNAINIGSIALFNTTGDPNDTVVLAGTGNEDLNRIDKLAPGRILDAAFPNEYRFDGVGFIISTNGGKDWRVLDSSNNYDALTQTYRPVSDPLRDHVFVGSTVKKVIFEKNPNTFTSLPIMYAVVGRGSAGQAAAGIWRSLDGGRNWNKIYNPPAGTDVSDFVLSEGSAIATSGNRPTTAYLAVEGLGVLRTTNLDSSSPAFAIMTGGLGRPTVNTGGVTTSAPGDVPHGAKGRIVLAVPSFVSNDPLANSYYRNWLFAAVMTPDGFLDGIYATKDGGLSNNVNWTKIKLPPRLGPDGETFGFDDNPRIYGPADPGPDQDFTGIIRDINGNRIAGGGNHSLTLATDPNDPNILYFGSDRMMRIDMTQTIDPYNLWMYANTNNDTGLIRQNTDGSVASNAGGGGLIATNPNTGLNSSTPGDGGQEGAITNVPRKLWNFVNLVKDPYNPFNTDTELNALVINNFNNTGGNTTWTEPYVARVTDPTSLFFAEPIGEDGGDYDWVSQIITVRDPITGLARVMYASDEGVGTFVSNSNGTLNEIQGFAQDNSLLNYRIADTFDDINGPVRDNYQIEGIRNGNIGIARLYSGETQPSLLAASISQSLLAAAGHRLDDAFISEEAILGTGNDDWISTAVTDRANYVAADQTGSGNLYILRRINDMYENTVDFFQISINGNPPISFTNGLFRNAADSQGLGQWDNTVRRFAINPIDKFGLLIGSAEGRLYRTDGSISYNWQVVAEPTELDGSYTTAMAFGAPNPQETNYNNHILVGTEDGSIFATEAGGGAGNWVDISLGLDGSDVMKIVPNPTRGSHEAYAVTEQGVYHIDDWTAVGATWVDITANIKTLMIEGFNNPQWSIPFFNDQTAASSVLTSIAIDWRPLTAPTPGLPILYVGGDGGVVRSTDVGLSWGRYPAAPQNASSPGGGLPVVKVVDIDLALGNIDPNTGRTLPGGSPDMLVATTLGRGMWVLPLGKPAGVSGPKVASATPTGPQDGVFDNVTIKFDSYIDPTSFTAADIVFKGPTGNIIPIIGQPIDTTAPAPGQPNLHNEWRINFAPQTVDGIYTITVGPQVSDAGGTFMNQNGNGINGETSDAFVFQIAYGRNDISDLIRDTYRSLLSPRDNAGTIIPGQTRVPTTAEFIAATTALEKGRIAALSLEAQRLLVTDEARTRLVEDLYDNGGAINEIGGLLPGTLAAHATDIANYVIRLKTKKITPQGIIAEIMASDEYVLAAGGTAQTWLTKVFQDLFKGTVPGSGITFAMLPTSTQTSYLGKTATFSQRLALMRSLTNGTTIKYDHDANPSTALLTNGFRQHLARLAYQKYLNRQPTTTELNAIVKKMNSLGTSTALSGIEHLYRSILATNEYFNMQNQKLENQPAVGPFPDTTLHTNRSWVDAVFEDRYFRAAGVGGFFSTEPERDLSVDRILNDKTNKAARLKFYRAVVVGTEFRTLKANEFYQTALGRNALPAEISSFLTAMKSSTQTLERRLATLIASTEFYNNAANLGGSLGNTPNERFVMAMYQRLLGRQPTPAELANRLAGLSSGRFASALNLIRGTHADTGPEYRTTKVIGKYYQDLLGRAPTATEQTTALSYLQSKRWEDFILNLILMSRNYHEIDQ